MVAPADVRRIVDEILPEIVEIRHSFHRIPETHYQERETSAAIRRILASPRIELLPPILGTDVVGLIRGGSPGRCVLLRSDIDALPVEEKTGKPWASTHPGKAHSCGHDGHMAILIGTTRVLERLAGELAGNVRLVFQPAEEEECGGCALVGKGLMDLEPRAEAAFALHGWVGVPVGSVSCAAGAMMAAADQFLITVKGRGGHAALPHRAVDPVVCAAQVVTALQTVVSRSIDPLEPAVLSVCRIQGGHASNVIPDAVVLEGTTRYFDGSMEALIRERMHQVIGGVCAAGGCTYELSYTHGYDPLVNHLSAVDMARGMADRWLGPSGWSDVHPRTMGAEDFAFYIKKVPGAMLRLGLGEDWPPLHSAGFDFNDQALRTGILSLAGLAIDFCTK
jgi:amidohydrolase